MRTRRGATRRARAGAAGLACVGLVIGLAACSSSSGGKASSNAGGGSSSSAAAGIPAGPIKVGIIGATSGVGAAIGNLVKSEFTAYTTYVNQQGGIAGHQVQLIFENSQSDPTIAVAQAKKLIEQGVVATFYNGSTAEGKEQVVALEQKAKIVGISPESLATYNDVKKYPYYFSDNVSNLQVTDALAAFAKAKGFTDFGVLGDSSPQANDYLSQFQGSVSKNGLHIVQTTSYPSTATVMTTQLSALKAAGAKTLALFCYSGCGQVFDSMRQISWKPNVLVSPNIYYTALKSVGDYGSNSWSACPYSVDPGAQPPAGVVAAINAIAPQVGGPSALDQVYAETADAYAILKQAIEQANSTNGDALRTAIESIKDKSFVDPSVKFTFDSTSRFGYRPATADGLVPMCGLNGLGAMNMPVRVTDTNP